MGISNINTLQNYEDLRYVESISRQNKGELETDYYIHSLANLEQRTEYRYSNGIKYGILYFDKTITVTGDDINDLFILSLNNDVSFDITVNNIETYLKNSQIYDDGNSFRTLLFGKIIGSSDEDYDVEIQYNDIDLSNHTFNEAYRIFNLNDSTNSNIFILLHLIKNSVNDVSINYSLTGYKLLIDDSNFISQLFKSITYQSSNLYKELVDKEISLLINDSDKIKDIFKQFTKYSVYSTDTINNNYIIDVTYDTLSETNLRISNESQLSDNFNRLNELLYFSYYNINQRITSLNNDLTITYPNLLKYFSTKQYNSNNDTLKNIIAKSLFNKIISDSADGVLTINEGTRITYVSNIENSLQIYYTDDIYVHLINDDKNISDVSSGIIYKYNGHNKTVIYNLYSKYNTKYDEFINCFVVNKKYTFPFIDDSSMWNINDQQTSIYASGESAGNPNILILKTSISNVKDSTICTKLNRQDIQNSILNYTENVSPIILTNNIIDDYTKQGSYDYVFQIPNITPKNSNKLNYAIIFAISDVIKNNDNTYSNGPIVTTIWSIGDDKSQFECIKMNDVPMLISDMMGLDSLLYKKFSEYEQLSNIFDDLIALRLNRTRLNGSSTNIDTYFTIEHNSSLNKNGSEKYDEADNNYNLVEFKINNKLSGTSITHGEQSEYDSNLSPNKLFNTWKKNGSSTKQVGFKFIKYNTAERDGTRDVNEATLRNDDKDSNITQNIAKTMSVNNSAVATNNESSKTTEHINDPKYNDDLNYESDKATLNVFETLTLTYSDIYDNNLTGIFDEYNTSANKTISKLNEYVPTGYISTLKESGILHQDHNVINRTNIYTFTDNSDVYYTYIGTSCNDSDKSIVRIGTSDIENMINLGKGSLISPNKANNDDIFKKNTTLSVDLNETRITSSRTNIDHYLTTDRTIQRHNYGTFEVVTISIDHLIHNVSLSRIQHNIIDKINGQDFNKTNTTITDMTFDNIEILGTQSIMNFLQNNYLTHSEYRRIISMSDDKYIEKIQSNKVIERIGNVLKISNSQFIVRFTNPLIVHIIKYSSTNNINNIDTIKIFI